MKRFISIFLLAILCHSIHAQDLTVVYVGGKVTSVKNGKNEKINVNSKLTKATVVDIPYEGKLDLIDEKNKKRYSISKPGKCDISTHISAAGNSTMELTERYLTYLKNQIGSNNKASKIVHAQVYSDYATVTREIQVKEEEEEKEQKLKELDKLTPMERVLAKRELNHKRHNAFRDSVIKVHLDFVRKAWNKHDVNEALARPVFDEIRPLVMKDNDNATNKLKIADWLRGVFSSKKHKEVIVQAPTRAEKEQPTPLFDIEELKESATSDTTYFPFEYCGTDFKVRLDETKRVNIGKVNPDRIADVLGRFSSGKYDNALYDCIQIRKEHNLNDWAYYKMIQTLCDEFFGKGTNESVLLAGYLCYQSGFCIRFASTTDGSKLYLLLNSIHDIYSTQYITCGPDAQKFYIFADNIPKSFMVCDAEFPKEKGISLYINTPLLLNTNQGDTHVIHGYRFDNDSISISINQNIMKFCDTYPSSQTHNNELTRWAMYANTPLQPDVKEQLYPQLKKIIEGKNEVEQVHRLMDLIHGIPYEYDENIWGHDRAFFAEETLNYPFCDCEDRSILLTRLVRDLVGLKCALLYYPGHLATLIHFNDEVKGAHYIIDDVKFTVCDPTYLGSNIGDEMPNLDTKGTKVILLD